MIFLKKESICQWAQVSKHGNQSNPVSFTFCFFPMACPIEFGILAENETVHGKNTMMDHTSMLKVKKQ